MNAADIADQAIQKMELEEAGGAPAADDTKPKGTEDDKKTGKDASDDKPDAGKGDKPAGDADADKSKDGDDDKSGAGKDDEGTFTADDALVTDDTPAADNAPTDSAGVVLSPGEQKFIAENIGEPIVIRGIRGTGDNAKEVEIKAYSPNDIPADFKFLNDQQLVMAQNGFQTLEQKAQQLLGNFRQNQSQQVAQDFEKRENEGIRADVADLQREGRFPKFKIQPGQPGFDDDPGAVRMKEVLDIMSERNETYLKQYQQGRPYKHIGFAEAFDIWEAKNPERQADRQRDDDQKQEDADRKAAAERGASNRGTTPSNIVKPTVRPGTTTREILARIDAEE